MSPRHLYAVGYGLGLVGSLAAIAGLVFVGAVASSVTAFVATFTFSLGLRSIVTRDDLHREHSLGYRIGNWGRAVFVVGLGLVMLAVGIVPLTMFG